MSNEIEGIKFEVKSLDGDHATISKDALAACPYKVGDVVRYIPDDTIFTITKVAGDGGRLVWIFDQNQRRRWFWNQNSKLAFELITPAPLTCYGPEGLPDDEAAVIPQQTRQFPLALQWPMAVLYCVVGALGLAVAALLVACLRAAMHR